MDLPLTGDGCTLSGNYDGAPLVVSGSCTSAGTLDLRFRGITEVAADAFNNMDDKNHECD